ELIDSIAEKTGVKKVSAEKVLSAYEATILETLKKGERVTIVGFGTYTVSERKERKGRNPKTGMEMTIPAKRVPKFVVGKSFKESF
ncbi:MAG: HU family DNA-binding protein, partial [Mucispirillum sp.]|nr:HU family DNA-binding protein [Mucispirillum sp.]